MPDVRLPNGKIVRGVPEGTTKEQLANKLRDNNVISQDEYAQMVPRQALDESLSTGERLLIGTGRGFVDVYEGAKQLGLEAGEFLGMVDPSRVKRFTEQAQQERDLYSEGDLGVAGTVGRIGGNIAATAVPGGVAAKGAQSVPWLARGAQALNATRSGRAAIAAGAGAAGGGSMFVGEGGSRLQNTALGGVTGAVAQPIVSGLSRVLQKIPRRLSRVATRNARRRAAVENLRGQVPDEELPNIADDIADGLTPEQALRKADIERIGGIPTRGRVSGDPGDLAFEVRAGRAQENASGDIIALQEVQQQNKRTILNRAQEMVDEFAPPQQAAPGTAGRMATESLTEAKRRVKDDIVTPAYAEAGEKLAQFADNVRIRTSSMVNDLSDEVDNLNDPQMAPVRSVLREFGLLKKVQGTDDVVLSRANTLNARQAESLRRRLSNIKGANPGRVAAKAQRALEDDVKRTFGEDLFAAARRTAKDEFFDKYVNPARVNAVIEGSVPPERITQNMRNWSADETSQFFRVLDEADPQAGQAMRASFMDDVMSRVRGEAQDVEGLPEITAATFSRNLKKIGDDKLNAVFGEGTAQQVKRFANSVKALTSVDRRAAGPNTANDLINAIGGAGYALQNKSPILGSLMISASRAIANSSMDRQIKRQARRALNINLLQNEQVMRDIVEQGVSVGGAAAAGQQGAQAGQEVRQQAQTVMPSVFGAPQRPRQ